MYEKEIYSRLFNVNSSLELIVDSKRRTLLRLSCVEDPLTLLIIGFNL